MGHPDPSLGRAQLRETLITALDHTMPAGAQIEYRLVGTGAALLHGVELPVADVDILVKEREGVDAIGAALSPFRCLSAPAWVHHFSRHAAELQSVVRTLRCCVTIFPGSENDNNPLL
jgi:hypothetical protein